MKTEHWNSNYLNKILPLTHANVFRLGDVVLEAFCPAFPFVAVRQEIRPQTAKIP
jgi:hypothetical protein